MSLEEDKNVLYMESNTDTKDQISGSIFGLYVYMSVLQCYTISYLFFFSDNFSFSVYSFGYSNFKGNENVIMDPYFHFDLLFFCSSTDNDMDGYNGTGEQRKSKYVPMHGERMKEYEIQM